MTTVIDERNSYRIKVRLEVECCKHNEYHYADIALSERCSTAKFDFMELKSKIDSLIASTQDDLQTKITDHANYLAEKEAKQRAMEEAGEAC